MDDSAQRTTRNGHVPRDGKREPSRSDETMQALSALNDNPEPRQTTTKQAPKVPMNSDISDTQATLRQAFPHVYSSSRAPSTRSSSSSLQALNEDTVVDARSQTGGTGRSPRRTSRPSDARPDYPVYPDQSYASLQSQVHPTSQPPYGRSRGLFQSHVDPIPRFARVSRTAGNTPISSPGLFSMQSPRTTPPSGSDGESALGSPYLHPTHLQPPKETNTAEVDRDQVTGTN
ncbi:hypothetical protein N7470_005634 [Penicillium chermesinum]|nr:hypothetical protein N7470_005634 [Penicillium chermesinum]